MIQPAKNPFKSYFNFPVMDVSYQRLKAVLELHSGRRSRPYDEATNEPVRLLRGHTLTIGVGRNLQDRDLSDDEIDLMLANDITAIQRDLLKNVPGFSRLSDVRKAVLIDLCHTIGLGPLMKMRDILQAISGGGYEVAAEGLLLGDFSAERPEQARRLARMMASNAWPKELRDH